MPDPHGNVKMRGDIHPPEVESDLPLQEGMPDAEGVEGTPAGRGKAAERGAQGRPGRGNRKAGLLKDQDDQGAGSPAAPASGESPRQNKP